MGRLCGDGRLEGVDWREAAKGIEGGVNMRVWVPNIGVLNLFICTRVGLNERVFLNP